MQCLSDKTFSQKQIALPACQSSQQTQDNSCEFVFEQTQSSIVSPIQRFIKASFANAYDADVHSFLPVLIGLKHAGKFCSAMGVRCNANTLFLEQYLPYPAATFLQRHNIANNPLKLAEIGNLCSRSRRYTLPMLTLVITALFLQQTDYVLFTANAPVRKLLESYHLPLIELVDADPNALHGNKDNWGSYYQTTPKVMALCVANSMEVVMQYDALQSLIYKEAAAINTLVNLTSGYAA